MLEFMQLFFSDSGTFIGTMSIVIPLALMGFCLFMATKD